MLKIVVFCTLYYLLTLITALAEVTEAELDKYRPTGSVDRCISHNFIKKTTVLDDKNILFEMRSKKILLNTLDSNCHQLGFNQGFSYNVRVGKLCRNDFIRVLSFNGIGATCVLNDFVELEKHPSGE